MKKPVFSIIALLLSFFTKAQTPYQLDTMPDGNGIVVEKFNKKYWNNCNRFNENNKIYRIGKVFVFDYAYSKNDTLKKVGFDKRKKFENMEKWWHLIPNDSTATEMIDSIKMITDVREKFEKMEKLWHFIPNDSTDSQMIDLITMTIVKDCGGSDFFEEMIGKEEYQQTVITYDYTKKNGESDDNESTGLVDNESNFWMHPPRNKFFMITEINPFPYIKAPFKIGTKWQWKLGIGQHWSHPAWLKWEGGIDNIYDYAITGREKIVTPLGKLNCWIVNGTATSRLGKTYLKSYFNEEYGFVKLDYINIDGSKLIFNLREVKN